MYCKHCGREIDDNSSFCKFCGIRQIPKRFSINPRKHNCEDEIRKGILSFFSFIKRLWNVLLLKYWLISYLLFLLLLGIWGILGHKFDDALNILTIVLAVCTILVIGTLYIRNFYKWLYKK